MKETERPCPGTLVRVCIPGSAYDELHNGVEGIVVGGEMGRRAAAYGRLAVTHELEDRQATRFYELRHITLGTA